MFAGSIVNDFFAFDVFLSYSSKDRATVEDIAERLREDGLKVWFDEWILKPGDNIMTALEEGLANARVIVGCISANFNRSDWTRLEIQAIRFRDPMNRERRFIPLRLDASPLDGFLEQFRYVSWLPELRDQEYPRLYAACAPDGGPPSRQAGKRRLRKSPKPSATAEGMSASIYVPLGYSDQFYLSSAYYLPLLYDKQFVYGPTKYGAQAVGVPAGDILTLALSKDPAIVPIGFERWIKGEEYRNQVLAARIRETQGAEESRKVLYVPDFDGQLEPVYQDAGFEWFTNRVNSAEEQQAFVESLLSERFIKAVASASQGIYLPPELSRLRPAGASTSDAELWHDFARRFLTMYVGDRGIATKFGATTAQSLSEWRSLYRLVDQHLEETEVNLGTAFGDRGEREQSSEVAALKNFDVIQFLNRVIEVPRPGGAIDIMHIRERGLHQQFRQWVSRYFSQKQWSMAAVSPEEIADEMTKELRIGVAAVRWRLLETLRAVRPASRQYSALAALLAGKNDKESMEVVRTLTLTSEHLVASGIAEVKKTLRFYDAAKEDFNYTYPIRLPD